MIAELAVWSGDTVRRDEEGFLYFVGRRDEMIKTSGYRVSPTEVEEEIYAMNLVGEAVAFGVKHPQLGQAIVVVTAMPTSPDVTRRAPEGRVPEATSDVHGAAALEDLGQPLPRNPNGKIDRKVAFQRRARLVR